MENAEMNPVAGTRHQMPRKRQGASGQGLVEYALLLVLVSIVVIGVLSLLGTATQGVFGLAVGALQSEGKGVSSSAGLHIRSATCNGAGDFLFSFDSAYPPSSLIVRTDLPYQFTYTGSDPGSYPVVIDASISGMTKCPQVVVLQHRPSGNITAARVKML